MLRSRATLKWVTISHLGWFVMNSWLVKTHLRIVFLVRVERALPDIPTLVVPWARELLTNFREMEPGDRSSFDNVVVRLKNLRLRTLSNVNSLKVSFRKRLPLCRWKIKSHDHQKVTPFISDIATVPGLMWSTISSKACFMNWWEITKTKKCEDCETLTKSETARMESESGKLKVQS
jgi:hypothetical protein